MFKTVWGEIVGSRIYSDNEVFICRTANFNSIGWFLLEKADKGKWELLRHLPYNRCQTIESNIQTKKEILIAKMAKRGYSQVASESDCVMRFKHWNGMFYAQFKRCEGFGGEELWEPCF